jgi:hypothetical protein
MLSNSPFYFGNTRKYIAAFGSLFNNIHIVRTSPDSATQTLKVPVTYGPKEKWLYRKTQDPMPGVDDQVEMLLPRMSFEIIAVQAQYNPVPYNFMIELNVMTKTIGDNYMITEQILPFFTPDYTITVNDLPELNLEKDIPIVLNGVRNEDTWTGDFKERRTLTSTLSFTLKGYLYPPANQTKVNLSSQLNYEVVGPGGVLSSLPTSLTTPYPVDSTALTVEYGNTVETENSVVIVVSPTTATLSSGQSQKFSVAISMTGIFGFTVIGAASIDTLTISGTNFTYKAGTRTSQQTVVLVITSDADPSRTAGVVLTLNP